MNIDSVMPNPTTQFSAKGFNWKSPVEKSKWIVKMLTSYIKENKKRKKQQNNISQTKIK